MTLSETLFTQNGQETGFLGGGVPLCFLPNLYMMHPLVCPLFLELASGKIGNTQVSEPNYPGPSPKCATSCVTLGNLLSSLATVSFFVKWNHNNGNFKGLFGSLLG